MKKILFFLALLLHTYATNSVARTWDLEKNVQTVIGTNHGKSNKEKPIGHEATHVIQQLRQGDSDTDNDGVMDFSRKKRTGRNPQTGAEIKTK